MAEQKLNIRQTKDNTLFYIDGQLQFSSEDEHIYHEMLVHPGAAIVNKRKSSAWRALILGGGDGLALREILKYRRCAAADLADHDPDVIGYAKTTFSKLNCNAFDDRRVSVFTEDAESYLRRSNDLYDLIISDFTFPNTPETARLFTSDFLMRIRDRLSDTGIFSMNAVSPTQHDKAYQAIFNTLTELKLNPLPLKFSIPSFVKHGYGQWGFFFGSRTVIALSELKNWTTKVKTRFIRKNRLSESLNVRLESSAAIIRTHSDMLNLLGVPIPFNVSPTQIDRDWIVRLLNILRSMDIGQLFDEVNRRTEHLSASLQEQLRYLRRELPLLLKEQVINIERAGQVLSVLMLIIIAVNLLCPDNMYAKGYSSGSSGHRFISQEKQPTPFHSEALQMATLAYAVNMQGKTYAKKSVPLLRDKSEEEPISGNPTEEELFYAVTDDIFLTPSGRAYMTPTRLAPYYYRMKPESFTLMREADAAPIISTMPDNETVYLLLTNLHTQISAVEKTITDYRKWNRWVSPLQVVSDSIRRESLEIGNLEKIRNALNAAYAKFIRYRPIKLPEPNPPRKVAPGIYQDHDGNTLLWLAENQWRRDIPDNLKEFVNKAISSEPKTPQPVQDKLLMMQQMLEKQLIEINP